MRARKRERETLIERERERERERETQIEEMEQAKFIDRISHFILKWLKLTIY